MIRNLLGGHSAADPPESMPNSEVKRCSADGSVGSPHVRVGNCQALIKALVLNNINRAKNTRSGSSVG